ncbi:MAG TPA: SigE family RNA polymerase sigma factor [Micromonosporaceae bacterium]
MIDSSFDEFVRGHLTALRRYAHALTGDAYAAEDLVQDTLVKMAGAWRRIHRDGNPAGYATTVMFRTHVSAWRHRRRRPPPLSLTAEPPSGRDAYAAVDARVVLRAALRTLPRLQRAVLVATFLDDRSDDEIAALLGRSPGSVRSLRLRGLRRLRAALGDDVSSTGSEVGRAGTGIATA